MFPDRMDSLLDPAPSAEEDHSGQMDEIEEMETATADEAVVRGAFRAYRDQDVWAAESLYAAQFVFTSPQDDHIDRSAFLERCFPTADRFVDHTMLHVVDLGDHQVFVMYEYELPGGERYRNTEVITVHDAQLIETQVFFGGQVR